MTLVSHSFRPSSPLRPVERAGGWGWTGAAAGGRGAPLGGPGGTAAGRAAAQARGGMTVGPAVNLSASWFVSAMRLEVCSCPRAQVTAGEEHSQHAQQDGQRPLAHGKLPRWLRCLKKKGQGRRPWRSPGFVMAL